MQTFCLQPMHMVVTSHLRGTWSEALGSYSIPYLILIHPAHLITVCTTCTCLATLRHCSEEGSHHLLG